jgi:hypothetical protein
MAKSKKAISKKVTPVEAPVEATPAPMPAVAEAAAAAETPSKPVRARKEKPERAVDDPAVKWKRRLGRWQAKAQAAGVDAKALMEAALAG